ncbi:DUF1090 domain-containing protein [Jejubacter calystegiae]|uniref:DUF1090 domain-containing protein n=1 Tax=Jejubacter calystegiae TaxID=2579935 RepID=A0A4P8YLD7_9ENTR|nr:DUF1090 domain-containing protein [Jejubacter calystegiae]QCT20993.1 DUF1090 domain-containing protein [Jejubacter calystegiae]
MKKYSLLLGLAIATGSLNTALAAEDCATRRVALERELHIAEQYNHHRKAAGLRQALAEVKAHCTPESVTAENRAEIRKLKRKVEDKQRALRETEEDLAEARHKGDGEKIVKYRRKLAEKRGELREAQMRLGEARGDRGWWE